MRTDRYKPIPSTNLLQMPLHLDDPNAVAVLASTANGPVLVWLDEADVDRLDGKKLHIGSHGYAQLHFDGQATPVHRWVMGAERGDGKLVDHIDGNPFDNRKVNLRWATYQMNAANRRSRALSGYRGVQATRAGRWDARATINGRCIYLGTFDEAEQAAKVAHEYRVANLPGYTTRGITNPAVSLHVAA